MGFRHDSMFLTATSITIQATDGALALTFSPGLPADNYAAMIDLLNQQQASSDYLRVILAGIADSWGVECTCECMSNAEADTIVLQTQNRAART